MTRLALLAFLAAPAFAWTPGAAYLGTCDQGVWHEGYFTGLPPCRDGAADATITANRGLAVRASATPPHGATLARLRAGARVHLTAMHRAGTSPHWWGDVSPATAPTRAPAPHAAAKAAGLVEVPPAAARTPESPTAPGGDVWHTPGRELDAPRVPLLATDDLAPIGWFVLFAVAIVLAWRIGAWKWVDLRLSAYRLARDEEYLRAEVGDREIRHARAALDAGRRVAELRVELQEAEARYLALDPAGAKRDGVPGIKLARIGSGR